MVVAGCRFSEVECFFVWDDCRSVPIGLRKAARVGIRLGGCYPCNKTGHEVL